MHPSRVIQGRRSRLLVGRRIIVAVTGSIAAVETPRIIRELLRHGAEVRAVASPDALGIITAEALHFATGQPPIVALTGQVEHVRELGPGEGRADLLLIAPATANTISKIAHGIDDTVVTSFASVALGGGVPILIAPAMHADMHANPAIAENLSRLRAWGVGIVAPQAAEGEAKIATPEEVAAAVLHRLATGPWAGRTMLVIGGASREPIDAVRSVTNESSGATAVALATQGYFRGAEVELWLGAVEVPVPSFLVPRRWRSLSDLRRLIDGSPGLPRDLAAVWVPAALSDFTLAARKGKIPSHEAGPLTLTLRPAPKVLPDLRRRARPPCRIIGFKLESGASTEQLIASGRRLQQEAGVDFVVANDRAAMGAPRARILLIPPRGEVEEIAGPKEEVASRLLEAVGPSLTAASRPAPARRKSPSRAPARGARA
jgi:phosphopantothenoylcysteine decarboxylase/phosphopantothenate--cysteine ligase